MKTLWGLVVAIFAWSWAAAAPAQNPPAYAYYEIGDVAAPTPAPTRQAMMLMGGGEWPRDAFRWFTARAGHGHLVVLRASGAGDAGEEIYRDIGGVLSVQTIVFSDRAAASDPRVLDILRKADGIFLAGGDQANYVRFWKDTPVAELLNAHVRKGRPIAGTSAGLAILGGTAYGAMDGGSVDSPTALADPAGPAVTLVTDFLHMPRLAHVVTDTHFAARDRLGRLIAFVAAARQRDSRAVGIGVDEESALCVEADGTARLHTRNGGFAWLVEPSGKPKLRPGAALDWRAIRVTGIGTTSRFDLDRLRVGNAAFSWVARVEKGQLLGAPVVPPKAAVQ
ncbi:cyanophycinase [Sphingomonas sp. DG1-23]|uniref:cyanophycinase n=1 Tax=Sphingomonas sp. DG1-23 TaxID=3068316 RepID=UPI00273F3DDB|nr:cyanophycinase [Sphingomonas sp. DG1-23]MDP5277485.1 cyanophycinase [Sphingomonas sp. DG1-23]